MNPYTEALYQNYARLGKALSTPARIALLELLEQAPYSVEDLAELSGLSVANTSQHLQHLRRAGLVSAHKKGLHVFYQLASPQVQACLQSLADLAHSQLAEVREIEAHFLAASQAWQTVTLDELSTRLDAGALLVDVRPAAEYQAAHLPEAVSVPLPELHQRLHELPKDREVIAYCRGPYCVFALQAVQLLQKEGLRAAHFRPGLSKWREAQKPVVSGL